MKYISCMKLFSRVLVGAGACALLCGAWIPAQAATPPSPVGDWDCVVSGKQGVGLAQITFAENYTFSGTEVLTVNPAAPVPTASSYDGRNPGADLGRGIYIGPGAGSGTNSGSSSGSSVTTSNSSVQLFGMGPIGGDWHYDIYGRVIGYFVQVIAKSDTAITTNTITTFQTNVVDGITEIITTTRVELETNTVTSGTTNIVSFLAKVAPGKRLSLTASTPNGKQVYTGRPRPAAYTDLTGAWYVNKRAKGQSLVEFFDATPGPEPFLFNINGTGAGYTFNGLAMVSSWNRIGFVFERGGATDGIIGATVGAFYPRKLQSQTLGIEEPSTPIRFNAYWYAPAAE
jgi:hypothetical protein